MTIGGMIGAVFKSQKVTCLTIFCIASTAAARPVRAEKTACPASISLPITLDATADSAFVYENWVQDKPGYYHEYISLRLDQPVRMPSRQTGQPCGQVTSVIYRSGHSPYPKGARLRIEVLKPRDWRGTTAFKVICFLDGSECTSEPLPENTAR